MYLIRYNKCYKKNPEFEMLQSGCVNIRWGCKEGSLESVFEE